MNLRNIILLCFVITFGLSCHSISKELNAYRADYKNDFLTDERSPLTAEDFPMLDFYPANKQAIVNARFVLTAESMPFELPTYSGITRTYRKWGEVHFKWGKDSTKLSVYENLKLATNPEYADYLFLPFTDATNGEQTYGGGRYLDLSKKDTQDGKIVIDFNHCYNPWCAYSNGYNCPIPPAENALPFSVEAGEKLFRGEHKGG